MRRSAAVISDADVMLLSNFLNQTFSLNLPIIYLLVDGLDGDLAKGGLHVEFSLCAGDRMNRAYSLDSPEVAAAATEQSVESLLPSPKGSTMSYGLVRRAILEKKAITAYYDRQYRKMCPHVLGTKDGKFHALFYQFGGKNNGRPIREDGSPEELACCIDIDLLMNVEISRY